MLITSTVLFALLSFGGAVNAGIHIQYKFKYLCYSTFSCFLLEILEQPQSQYVLVGNNATVTCKTRGTLAYWVINRTVITISHPEEQQYYESLGIVFMKNESRGYYNLTMIVPAIVTVNNTAVFCQARDSDHRHATSNEVFLVVFTTLRKS